MTHRTALKRAISATIISLAGFASQQASASDLMNDQVVHLPATAIFATENNGKFAVITDTGRFIIQGTVYDVWDQKEVKTLEDARWASTHIPLHKAKVGFEDLEPFSVGQGDKVINLFVDIQCGFCKEIIAEARNGLPEGYRLDVIMLPLFGPDSTRRATEIHCASDKAAAWQVAVKGDMTTPLKQKPAEDCNNETLTKRMVTAQFIGARSVPFMIRDDGLVQQGKPEQGLRAWLQANR